MLADSNDIARLRPLPAFSRMEGEPDFVSDGELLEAAIGHGIAMEVDFSAIAGIDEAVVALGHEACHLAMGGNRMRLHVASPAADMIFELATHGVEAVAYRDVYVLVGVMLGRVAGHHDLLAGHLEIDADVEQIAMAAPVRRFDGS